MTELALFGLQVQAQGSPKELRTAAAHMIEAAAAALRVDTAEDVVTLCEAEASAVWLLLSSARDLVLASDHV